MEVADDLAPRGVVRFLPLRNLGVDKAIEEFEVKVEALQEDLGLVHRSVHHDVLRELASTDLQHLVLKSALLHIDMTADSEIIHDLLDYLVLWEPHRGVQLGYGR